MNVLVLILIFKMFLVPSADMIYEFSNATNCRQAVCTMCTRLQIFERNQRHTVHKINKLLSSEIPTTLISILISLEKALLRSEILYTLT